MTTNNHPAHGPVSLERLHQIRETLSKASAQSDGGNLGYAMADAVKVIDGAIAAFGAEPVLYAAEETLAYAKIGELHLKCLSQPMGDAVIPLYLHAQPAPAIPDECPAELSDQIIDICDGFIVGDATAQEIWNACRAAMLQAGNSPVTPDGWIPVSERMPPNKPGSYEYIVFDSLNNKAHHDYWNVPDGSCDDFSPFWNHYGKYVTHWMPLPAAPQQEQSNG
ncbi:DUF551 domain-containing protein [Citrobacter cronae]|uniref:DUF551 domain-containing protein n=1 Tax=Citrobacter cronae TaxID=1748967 RepID=UPI0038907078